MESVVLCKPQMSAQGSCHLRPPGTIQGSNDVMWGILSDASSWPFPRQARSHDGFQQLQAYVFELGNAGDKTGFLFSWCQQDSWSQGPVAWLGSPAIPEPITVATGVTYAEW